MESFGYNRFTGLTAAAGKAIQRIKAAKMARYGLSAAHTDCLCDLLAADGTGLTQSQLAEKEQVDRAQVSRILRQLVQRGYAAGDGRGGAYNRRYCLTDQGRAAAGEIEAAITEVNRFVSGRLAPETLSAFYETLEYIVDNLNEAAKTYTWKEEEPL